MQPSITPEILPPEGQPAAPELEEGGFGQLPPEAQAAVMEIVHMLLEGKELPPELMGPPPEMMGGPQDMGPPQQMGPPGGMPPMPPMGGAPPMGPPGGGMPPMMPGPGMGMQEGGPVRGEESMEELHRQINDAKRKLKEREKAIRDEIDAVTGQGPRGVSPQRPLPMAEGGNVPPSWWAGDPERWGRMSPKARESARELADRSVARATAARLNATAESAKRMGEVEEEVRIMQQNRAPWDPPRLPDPAKWDLPKPSFGEAPSGPPTLWDRPPPTASGYSSSPAVIDDPIDSYDWHPDRDYVDVNENRPGTDPSYDSAKYQARELSPSELSQAKQHGPWKVPEVGHQTVALGPTEALDPHGPMYRPTVTVPESQLLGEGRVVPQDLTGAPASELQTMSREAKLMAEKEFKDMADELREGLSERDPLGPRFPGAPAKQDEKTFVRRVLDRIPRMPKTLLPMLEFWGWALPQMRRGRRWDRSFGSRV